LLPPHIFLAIRRDLIRALVGKSGEVVRFYIDECVTLIQFTELKQSISLQKIFRHLWLKSEVVIDSLMVQETMMKTGNKVKEIILEEQVNMGGEIKVLHVVEEEVRIEEMMTMKNLNLGMVMVSPNVAMVVVIIEASTKKSDLGNLSLPCQNLMVDLILKIISHGN
jgi:hypothetical protein